MKSIHIFALLAAIAWVVTSVTKISCIAVQAQQEQQIMASTWSPQFYQRYVPPEISQNTHSHQTDLGDVEQAESLYNKSEIVMLAQMVWGEARGCTPEEQRLVVWTVFQRVDAPDDWDDTMAKVLTAPNQFQGLDENHPIDPDIYLLCIEEAAKWANGDEAPILSPYATELPYYFFESDGKHNYFREGWKK